MKRKLTLSLPEETIERAKRQADAKGISVSRLFAQSLNVAQGEEKRAEAAVLKRFPDLRQVTGVLNARDPFDARSAHVRKKHG